MDEVMVKVYLRRIKRGNITLDDVPEHLRDKVAEMLYA